VALKQTDEFRSTVPAKSDNADLRPHD